MNTTPTDAGGASTHELSPVNYDEELSILDMLLELWAHKWLVGGATLAVGALTAVITLMMPNNYTATARLLPPQPTTSTAAALLGQLGGIAAAAGGGGTGIRNPNELYVGLLKSRTVADRLIQQFELEKHFGTEVKDDLRRILGRVSRMSAGKDGIISIGVELADPRLAAAVANAYADELIRLTGVLAVTEASQRRLFFERQLERAREKLAAAEGAARDALAKGGLAAVEGQGRALVEASSRLRAQITAKEVQVGAMRSFAAQSNPDLKLAQQELVSLRAELARIEGATSNGTREHAGKGATENVKLLRDLRYLEALQELLVRQTEAARLDEAKDTSLLQVLDTAVVPDRKTSPQRTVIVIYSALLAFVLVSIALVTIKIIRPRFLNKVRSRRGL